VIGDKDRRLRVAVFDWLTDLRSEQGDLLPWETLRQGMVHDGDRVHVLGPHGIFKPRRFELPLSITTSPKSLYADRFDSSRGVLRYAYRGTDPSHQDNVGLRRAMTDRVPLVYFHGIEPGSYLASYPVFVVGDDPNSLFFSIQADDISAVADQSGEEGMSLIAEESAEPRRAYVTATVRRRLHQLAFRERVVTAYRERCALCRLGHRELLDAAHITPDSDAEGEPVIPNGLALCKLHHAAFDRLFFAVTPDYIVEVKPSILLESDGQMLIVGLQQIHGQEIHLPVRSTQYPDRDRLARRYAAFKQAS
jgi:putative restriction endonuclease